MFRDYSWSASYRFLKSLIHYIQWIFFLFGQACSRSDNSCRKFLLAQVVARMEDYIHFPCFEGISELGLWFLHTPFLVNRIIWSWQKADSFHLTGESWRCPGLSLALGYNCRPSAEVSVRCPEVCGTQARVELYTCNFMYTLASWLWWDFATSNELYRFFIKTVIFLKQVPLTFKYLLTSYEST